MACHRATASDTQDGEVAAMANNRANFALLLSFVLRSLLDLEQRLTPLNLSANGIRISVLHFFRLMPKRERPIQFKRHSRNTMSRLRLAAGISWPALLECSIEDLSDKGSMHSYRARTASPLSSIW